MLFKKLTNAQSNNLKKYSLIIGIVISVLIHLVFLIKLKIYLPVSNAQQKYLQLTLSSRIAETPSIQQENIEHRLDPESSNPTIKSFDQTHSEEKITDNPQESLIDFNKNVPPASKPARPEDTPSLSSPSPIDNQVIVQQNSDQSLLLSQVEPASLVEVKFEIYSENEQRSLGFGTHHFERNNAGEYRIQVQNIPSTSEENSNEWQLEIKGHVYRNALGPNFYQKKGKIPTLLMSLGDVTNKLATTGLIADNILDRQSMFYQFMFNPPAVSEGKLTLTDSSYIAKYTYINQGMEIIDTPTLGKLRAVKIIISAIKSNESIELWLAPDFKYLPLKIRHTDNNHRITDQITYEINLN